MSAHKRVLELEKQIIALEAEIKVLRESNQFLLNKLYGTKSEKTKVLADQISLFNEAEIEANDKAAEVSLEQVEAHVRRRVGQREELLKNLPHEKQLHTLVEEERYCLHCNSRLVSVGEEFIRTEIIIIPPQIKVVDIYRETFQCIPCRNKELPHMEKSPVPYPVIQHSMASASTVAWVMCQKYVNAVPLYRQETDWINMGVKVSRSTLANWVILASKNWLQPMVDLMHRKLLEEKYLHADETTVQVMKETGRKNTAKSYMWVYSSSEASNQPIRIFDYKPGRSGEYAQKFLKGFQGYLHCDAYPGYNRVDGVTLCYCWSHMRRKFVDAIPKGISEAEATIPGQGIQYCNQLFEIEKDLQGLGAKDRYQKRLKKAKPILEAFWSWVDQTANRGILPKSKLGEAIQYALNQKEGLMNYLLDGNCALSNNLSENSIRPFTIGRKNWLFSASPAGADASACVYSIIETAKANGLTPYKYLKFLLTEIPGMRFNEYPELLDDYLPWNPLVQERCK